MVATSVSWRSNSGVISTEKFCVLNPSPAALQPVAWQEDSGGFWRTVGAIFSFLKVHQVEEGFTYFVSSSE